MDMKKFTEKSQLAVAAAQDIAIGMGHQQVDVEHLAIALVRQEGGLVTRLLEKAGVNPRTYADALHKELAKKRATKADTLVEQRALQYRALRLPAMLDKQGELLRALDVAALLRNDLLVVGTNDADMALAANTLAEVGGGMVVVADGVLRAHEIGRHHRSDQARDK